MKYGRLLFSLLGLSACSCSINPPAPKPAPPPEVVPVNMIELTVCGTPLGILIIHSDGSAIIISPLALANNPAMRALIAAANDALSPAHKGNLDLVEPDGPFAHKYGSCDKPVTRT